MSEEGYWWEEILRIENSRCKGPGAGVILISWGGGCDFILHNGCPYSVRFSGF